MRIRQNSHGASAAHGSTPGPELDTAPAPTKNGTANGAVRSIRLSFPARAEYITLGRLALTGLVRAHHEPLSAEVVGDLKLALTEACTNSVRHAYARGEGVVEVLYELHPDRLVIEVVDEGEGFDPSAVPETSFDEALLEGAELTEGGLGIAIIEALADELELSRPDQGGSRLRFVKLL